MYKYKIMFLGGSGAFYMELKEMPWVNKIRIIEDQEELLSIGEDQPHVILLTSSLLIEEKIVELTQQISTSIKIYIHEDKRFNSLIKGKLEQEGVQFIDDFTVDAVEKSILSDQEDQKEKKRTSFFAKEKVEDKAVSTDEEEKNKEEKATGEEPKEKEKPLKKGLKLLKPFTKSKDITRGRIVPVIGSRDTGKTTICASLGEVAALNKVRVAIVDMMDDQELLYQIEIDEWKESDQQGIKWIRYNKYLDLYRNDNPNNIMEASALIELTTSLAEDYDLVLIDTKIRCDEEGRILEKDVVEKRNLLSLADKVLMIQDFDRETLARNEGIIIELQKQGRINLNKWVLVLNKAIENFAYGKKEIHTYYKELSQEKDKIIQSVMTIPLCYKACMESKWLSQTPIASKHVSKEYKEALDQILEAIR